MRIPIRILLRGHKQDIISPGIRFMTAAEPRYILHFVSVLLPPQAHLWGSSCITLSRFLPCCPLFSDLIHVSPTSEVRSDFKLHVRVHYPLPRTLLYIP